MAEIRGVESTARALRKLSPTASDEIQKALDKGAGEVKALASSIAPRDDGELQQAIEVRSGDAGGPAQGAFTAFRAALSGVAPQMVRRIGVFPDLNGGKAFYARWVEFGTSTGRPAQPFLMPAYATLRRRIQGRVKRAINRGIKEVARRG